MADICVCVSLMLLTGSTWRNITVRWEHRKVRRAERAVGGGFSLFVVLYERWVFMVETERERSFVLLIHSFPRILWCLLSAILPANTGKWNHRWNVFPFKVRLTQPLSVWLPFKTNLIRQEFGLLGSGTLGNCLAGEQSAADGEDTDVSHQEAAFNSALMGKIGPALQTMVSRLIYLIGSQDA